MRKLFHLIILSFFHSFISSVSAQDVPTSIDGWAKRLEAFGKSIPQEEVFVHMDNTSYFLGDTIFYKAYCRLSTGQPSKLSGLLYVELLNNDGYLVEREKIKLVNGEGSGCFLLSDTLYGGYYELRAYTRWQLNWGQFEHPHTRKTKDWFYSKQMENQYFRDFEKLYSRVFPVYDKPKNPGEYFQDMTMRPMLRYFRADHSKPEADVTFYPEGGNLVAGTTCRVAFEANDDDGKHLKGKLTVFDKDGQQVAEVETQQRGRGSFLLPVKEKEKYTATFTWTASNAVEYTQKCKLPDIETDGAAMQTTCTGDAIHLDIQTAGTAANEELGYTVMSHGVLQASNSLGKGAALQADIDATGFPDGVAQITVFNSLGRVYADRLVFVRHAGFASQNIVFSGIKEDGYKAYEPINIKIKAEQNGASLTQGGGASISVAVRDAAHSEYTFDSGNILTEMLLASQVKGFIEQPEYYFEADDEEHRQALDLLLMIQGWRRYNWVEMATPKAFTLTEPYEKTEWIYGDVNRYQTEEPEDLFGDAAKLGMDEAGMSPEYDEFANSIYGGYATERFIHKWGGAKAAMLVAKTLQENMGITADAYAEGVPSGDMGATHPSDTEVQWRLAGRLGKEMDDNRQKIEPEVGLSTDVNGNLKHEVTVHAEFMLDTKVVEGGEKGAIGEMMTYNNGKFRIEAPAFSNYCYFFCTASDQKKWKNGKAPVWIAASEDKMNANGDYGTVNYPEFYVRFHQPYPRFVKPYNFYQASQNTSPRKDKGKLTKVDDAHLMNEVVIGAKRSGLRGFDASKPAFVLDAQDAFNEVVDAGLCPGYYIGSMRFVSDLARTYIGDMNMERQYDIEARFNSRNLSFSFSPGVLQRYNHLHKLDKVYIYTDYAPRREGDKRYSQSNQPQVTVDLRIPDDNTQFVAYRDRRKVLWGFSDCIDFYHPDYSHTATPNPKDYRRTLYWNPDLKLDDEGCAEIHLFNNNSLTHVTISAEGMNKNGEPLTGISYPEDR